MYAVPRDTIIQVWQSGKNIMQSVVDAGYYALLSAGWYLNHQVTLFFFIITCVVHSTLLITDTQSSKSLRNLF